MHRNSLQIMDRLITAAIRRGEITPGSRVLDVGSFNVNGTYRRLVEKHRLTYVGTDLAAGPNVDVVDDAYRLGKFEDASFDVVISGQALEHMEFPLLAAMAMKRVLKPGGPLLLIAPFAWPQHRYPLDCWRIVPDGMKFLLDGMEAIETGIDQRDCWGSATKPANYRERWIISDRQTPRDY